MNIYELFVQEVNRIGIPALAHRAGVSDQGIRNILKRGAFSKANSARRMNRLIEAYVREAVGAASAESDPPKRKPRKPKAKPKVKAQPALKIRRKTTAKAEKKTPVKDITKRRSAADLDKESKKLHSSGLSEKLEIRHAALAVAGEGYLWVPFCGFGECPSGADYPMDRVIACDVDAVAVGEWREKWPQAKVTECAAEKFERWPTDGQITFADIDTYETPWLPLYHLLQVGPVASRLEVVVTDGGDMKRTRGKVPYNFETYKYERMASKTALRQIENLCEEVVEWLASIGWAATVNEHKRHGRDMRYIWFTLEGQGRLFSPGMNGAVNGGGDNVHFANLEHKRNNALLSGMNAKLKEIDLAEKAGNLVPVGRMIELGTAVGVSIRRNFEILIREARRMADKETVELIEEYQSRLSREIAESVRRLDVRDPEAPDKALP